MTKRLVVDIHGRRAEPGGGYRNVIWSVEVPAEATEEGVYIGRVALQHSDGLLCSIPLTVDIDGPPWPPLPLQDWSAVSDAYREAVEEASRNWERRESLRLVDDDLDD